jgi:hypothetical protein
MTETQTTFASIDALADSFVARANNMREQAKAYTHSGVALRMEHRAEAFEDAAAIIRQCKIVAPQFVRNSMFSDE